MKYPTLLCLCLAMVLSSQAANNEKKLSTKIDHVTVFMQGAQVYRTGATLIPKGTSYLVIDNVSPYINPQSIQASGKGIFTIMDVQYRYYYPTPVEVVEELPSFIQRQINQIKDSLQIHALQMDNLREKQKAISTERNLIMNHPLMKGQGKADSLDLLKGMVAYMQKQLVDIADRNMQLSLMETRLMKHQTDMNQRLNVLQNYNSNKPKPSPEQPKHQVLIMVNAENAVNGQFEVNYAVRNAGWNPWYDIKAKSTGEKIELIYKAAIYQNTGEDWNDVKLTVSNANPMRGSTKPMLPVWYIDFYQHLQKNKAISNTSMSSQYLSKREDVNMEEAKVVEADAKIAADYTQRQQNFTSVEFAINLPYEIESNGKAHFVTIARHELKASFEHFLVPKLDNDAFVVAHITEWENLDLLTGSANIYFGNTFVGRTVLDPAIVSDTLDLSMGRDQTIGVKRTRLKSETKSKIIGSNKEYVATYQIEIRNNGNSTVQLTLEDQIPKTNNEKIEIEMIKSDGGVLNPLTGLISWKMKIDAGKKQTIVFTYKITYPKDQQITGL